MQQGNKRAPYLEKVLIILAVILFLSISGLLIFQREWVDSFLGRDVSQQEIADVADVVYDVDEEEEEGLEVDYVSMDISDGGKASINLEGAYRLAGIEFELSKDEDLNITDFVCEEPFECIKFSSDESLVRINIITPIDIEENMTGLVELGQFIYMGSGNLFLDSRTSVIVSSDGSRLMFLDNEFTF